MNRKISEDKILPNLAWRSENYAARNSGMLQICTPARLHRKQRHRLVEVDPRDRPTALSQVRFGRKGDRVYRISCKGDGIMAAIQIKTASKVVPQL